MFVTLDYEAMRVIHVHSDCRVASDLATIELPHVACAVLDVTTVDGLRLLSQKQLQALFSNTCGKAVPGFLRSEYETNLLALLRTLSIYDCDPYEVRVQATAVQGKGGERFRYVKGSLAPSPQVEDFEPPHYTSSATPAAPVLAERRPCDQPPAVTTPQARAPRAHSAPQRIGGVAALVGAVADSMWESAGKPADARQVLALRKEMMVVLMSKHGMNKSTASHSLGDWQKVRLN